MPADIQTILLSLDGNAPPEAVLHTALLTATHFSASLNATMVSGTSTELLSLAGEGLAGGMIDEVIRDSEQNQHHRLTVIRSALEELSQQGKLNWDEGAHSPPSSTGPCLTLDLIDSGIKDMLTWKARFADLILMPHPSHAPHASSLFRTLLFESSRPLLMAPPFPPTSLGNHVALAWNGSAEAAVALHHTLPWAHKAQRLTLLYTPHDTHHGPNVEDAAAFLEKHHLHTTIHTCHASTEPVGAALLEAVHEINADLLSIGAFSHSSLRQRLLGSTTRYIMNHADIPILMSR